MAAGDKSKYDSLYIVDQGFEEFHETENADYESWAFPIEHDLGYTPIALVYMLSTIGTPVEVTAENFIGEQLPSIGVGFSGPPWNPYDMVFARADKQYLNIYRQSFHTNDGLDYNFYFKYLLLAQSANA